MPNPNKDEQGSYEYQKDVTKQILFPCIYLSLELQTLDVPVFPTE